LPDPFTHFGVGEVKITLAKKTPHFRLGKVKIAQKMPDLFAHFRVGKSPLKKKMPDPFTHFRPC
jgi:hypothetical protein